MPTPTAEAIGSVPPVPDSTMSTADGQAILGLRERFRPRDIPPVWSPTTLARDDVIARLFASPFVSANRTAQAARRRGIVKILNWLELQSGATWQARWQASGAEQAGGAAWPDSAVEAFRAGGRDQQADRYDVMTGMLMLICGDIVRPSLGWLVRRQSNKLATAMASTRDPSGFAALETTARVHYDDDRLWSRAKYRVAMILAAKGGVIADIAVGDCVELADLMRSDDRKSRGHQLLYYQLLREMRVFPDDAPPTLRMFKSRGQLSPEELIDRYQIECKPVRDLLVDYIRERQSALDYSTLTGLAYHLGLLFWRDLELHHPGIDSLHLSPEVSTAWKQRLRIKTIKKKTAAGDVVETTAPRRHAVDNMIRVRAFYLDLAQWALEEPTRWGPWAVPCPIRAEEVLAKKELQHRKARMDQRTRERLPLLPTLVRTVEQRRRTAAALLQSAQTTCPGETFSVNDRSLIRVSPTHGNGTKVWAEDPQTGQRRDLSFEDDTAFWSWAVVEVLRHTGIRVEELLELSHHSFIQYRLPATGELIPLLQIVPSKTDVERLLVISPELADVLSAIVCRVRDHTGKIPLTSSYDPREAVWNPPMPLLFQRRVGTEQHGISRHVVAKLLNEALQTTGLTGPDQQPLTLTPHDFRRMFVTDAVMSGLPPHIAQIICGHRDINTTMGYKAVYPAEAIESHRAWTARRRATRPSEEYRTPTEQEWDEFLGHFERRKVSIGTCGRAFGTSCIHEHACVRCAMLRPDPAQRSRLIEIRDNLQARIFEAETEGWLGEVEGLRTSLTGAEDKIAQLDQVTARQTTIHLGMPALGQLVGRIV